MTLSLTEIIAVLSFIGGLLSVFYSLRAKIIKIETEVNHQRKILADHISTQRGDFSEYKGEVIGRFQRLEEKTDELKDIIIQSLKK